MKRSFYSILLLLSICVGSSASNVDADRWTEIDLYWFSSSDKKKSVEDFWERYYPLYKNVDGIKGVILNVGWLADYILEWSGNINDEIDFPKMKTHLFYDDLAQLGGNTQEKMQLHKERFEKATPQQPVAYDLWTYKELKELTNLIREVGRNKYKINNFKVGCLVLGWRQIYNGTASTFATKHPNIFKDSYRSYPNLEATLKADPTKYGAYPNGITEGTQYVRFFGEQWGSFSKAVNFDAIVLRDSYMGAGIYNRFGPYGKTAPKETDKIRNWHNATSDLIKFAKLGNPKAMVIGYSNAATAVGDWRVNCFDLETIAKEGYLDAWIDQTWGGGWNEVGQRPGNVFWNYQSLAWSYQLAYTLVHAAILAETNVRHYVLTETFDAWESWDVINSVPDRLKWGIWAYSHAAVKTPKGLKMPRGNYITWGNKEKELLSKENVEFLATNSDEAFSDARKTVEVYGPTMVYCRNAMKWQNENTPDVQIKEWIDEQIGSVNKWSVPVMSITRSEYFNKVQSDMFIFQTPVNLSTEEKTNIIEHIRGGSPTMIIGSTVGGIDKDIAKLIGLSTISKKIGDVEYIASINGKTNGIYENLPNTFPLFQPFTRNVINNVLNLPKESAQGTPPSVDKNVGDDYEIIYTVRSSPCLIYNKNKNKQVLYWDAPELAVNVVYNYMKENDFGRSCDEILGSPTPFVLTSRKINEMLKTNNKIAVEKIEQYYPMMLSYWKLKSGEYRILAGNMDEGINHSNNQERKIKVIIPKNWGENSSILFYDVWNKKRILYTNRVLPIYLDQSEVKLFSFINR